MKTPIILVTLFLMQINLVFAESADVIAYNPSMKPLKPVPGEPWRSLERYRFVADFNFDSYQDIALSMDKKFFGNAGGLFDIYIGLAEGKYKRIGALFAHPMAVHISKGKSGAGGIITVYSRQGGSSGLL